MKKSLPNRQGGKARDANSAGVPAPKGLPRQFASKPREFGSPPLPPCRFLLEKQNTKTEFKIFQPVRRLGRLLPPWCSPKMPANAPKTAYNEFLGNAS